MGGYSEVLISDHGETNPRRLPVYGTRCSWGVSAVGSFSAFVRLEDLRAAGLAFGLDGKWLRYEGRAGAWAGVISDAPSQDGVQEIAAEGWATLLRGRQIEGQERPLPAGQVAGHARRALAALGANNDYHHIRLGSVDEGGSMYRPSASGQDALNDYLADLVKQGGLEWVIDAEREMTLSRRVGRDLSASVRLFEGVHFVSPELTSGHWTRSPAELIAIESVQERIYRAAAVAASGGISQTVVRRTRRRRKRLGGNRDRWRPGMTVSAYVPETVVSEPGPAGVGIVTWEQQPVGVSTHMLSVPTDPATPIDTTPMRLVLIDRDNAWARCALGNTVRVVVDTAGFSGWFRVLERGYDEAAGELQVAGEALSDARSGL